MLAGWLADWLAELNGLTGTGSVVAGMLSEWHDGISLAKKTTFSFWVVYFLVVGLCAAVLVYFFGGPETQ